VRDDEDISSDGVDIAVPNQQEANRPMHTKRLFDSQQHGIRYFRKYSIIFFTHQSRKYVVCGTINSNQQLLRQVILLIHRIVSLQL
jgi:hypothetical protein